MTKSTQDYEHNGRILKPCQAIVGINWDNEEVILLEIYDYHFQGMQEYDKRLEQLRKESSPNCSYHTVINNDVRYIKSKRLIIP